MFKAFDGCNGGDPMDGTGEELAFDSSFFTNHACPYLPCHEGVELKEFNCLFCYCPLYALGDRCGGDFAYTASGIKDCTNCTRLHRGKEGVSIVRERFSELADLARRNVDLTDKGVGTW
jgi:Zn-finger protein